MNKQELKRCPFCGGRAATRRYYNSYKGERFFVECMNCEATSSHQPIVEYAEEKWNRRESEKKGKINE